MDMEKFCSMNQVVDMAKQFVQIVTLFCIKLFDIFKNLMLQLCNRSTYYFNLQLSKHFFIFLYFFLIFFLFPLTSNLPWLCCSVVCHVMYLGFVVLVFVLFTED